MKRSPPRAHRAAALGLTLIASLAGPPLAAAPVAAVLAPATPQSLGFSPERLAQLDRYINGEIAAKHKAGAVVVIARRGRLAYLKAYGLADVASGRPMRTDDYFRWYSMTKPITAVALLTLYEQGRFQLTDRLDQYLPEFTNLRVYTGVDAEGRMQLAELARPVTIQDVFRHTAGFTYEYLGATPVHEAYRAAGVNNREAGSLQELIARLAKMPLLFQPSTRYGYGLAADVQARLVEVLSGMPFGEYCQKVILDPLGMKQTVWGVPPELAQRFVTSYDRAADGGFAPEAGPDGDRYKGFTGHPFGGAGLSGPPRDYLRFAQMLLNGGELGGVRILGRRTVELMTADHLVPGTPGVQEGQRHGLGVWVVTDIAQLGNLASVGQYGRGGLATTYMINDPKEQLVMLLFAQYFPIDQQFIDTATTLVYLALVP